MGIEMDEWRDWHAIQLGQLVEYGFVSWDESWAWDWYDEEQRDRWQSLFEGRYWWREIAIVPPGRWKQQLLQKLNEAMPKYKPLYKMAADGLDPLQASNEYGKSRDIFSEFPQTMLSGDIMGKFAAMEKFRTVDQMLLDEVEPLFSCLFTTNVNSC